MEVTKELLKEKFNEYNKLYFGGKLGNCQFYFFPKNRTAFGKYTLWKKTSGEDVSHIYIGSRFNWNEQLLKEVLVHEMIHMYVTTIEGVKYDGVLGHGKHFRKQAKRIAKNYGIIISAHSFDSYTGKEVQPKLWERLLLWLIDW